MRLIRTFGLAALSAVASMAFVGVMPASAQTSTQLCTTHTALACSNGVNSAHLVLAPGTVLRLLSPLTILCLGELWEISPLTLGKPQEVHILRKEATGCGTNSAHSNCTLITDVMPLANLLKLGLDEGTLELLSGQMTVTCPGTGIDCTYDLAGALLSVAAQHFTLNKTPTQELGGKFICPNEGFLDGLLQALKDTPAYVLQ